jgi:hypothetical protein
VSAHTEVELDVFSGMPNPTWVLTEADSEGLARRLARLPRVAVCELSGRLGYRGLVVTVVDGPGTRRLRVHAGCVQIAERRAISHARDEGRELERWLISTGRPRLPERVVEIVERELG